jgi:hypothetical protein
MRPAGSVSQMVLGFVDVGNDDDRGGGGGVELGLETLLTVPSNFFFSMPWQNKLECLLRVTKF